MKKPLAHVTDHAVLRHLERVLGVDVEAIRRELGHKVDAAVEAGAVATVSEGIRYILIEDRLVSCVPVKSTPVRGRAMRRRRVRDEEDGE
jgi:hypothetical protein